MNDLTSLIERLEKAKGPDSELDADIAIALNVIPSREWWSFNYIKSSILGRYTASTDAAVALAGRFLPNWQINLSIFHDTLAEASFGNREAPHARSQATKPALAICLATLRAFQSKGPEA